MPLSCIHGMLISFSGLNLFNFIRKKTIEVSGYRGVEQIRLCLKRGTPVKVIFKGGDDKFKARMIPFIQGLSSYFGAEAHLVCNG